MKIILSFILGAACTGSMIFTYLAIPDARNILIKMLAGNSSVVINVKIVGGVLCLNDDTSIVDSVVVSKSTIRNRCNIDADETEKERNL